MTAALFGGPLVIAIILAIPALLLVAAHLLAGVRVDVERRGEWDGISEFARFRATLADEREER